MRELFITFLYQPIFNLFVGLYDVIPDVGIVILIITVAIKLALHPLSTKSIKAQRAMQALQPKMKAIKEQYKDDKQAQAKETMKLYGEHKVSPLSSCLPILVQLPVFIALYYVLRDGLTADSFELLYSFVPNPGSINPISLGLFDLSQTSVVLAVLAAGTQFFQAKLMQTKRAPKEAGTGGKDEDMSAMMSKQMMYFMPIITLFIGLTFPGGLTLYWFLSTLFMLLQQLWIMRGEKQEDGKGIVEGELVE